jgi:hypothetical protein
MTARKTARRSRWIAGSIVLRRNTLLEGLERRSMLSTTVLNPDGSTYGTVQAYVPAGGVQYADPVKRRGGSAGGDGAPGYQITLNFTGGLTASQQAIFTAAAARWESVITGELPDVNSGGLIDDVRINASGTAIDGAGGILGSAGPSGFRSGTSLPYAGSMNFDTADLASLEAAGRLNDVITHEMGHVLGVGTIWSARGMITGTVAAGTSAFIGANALAEYKAYRGAGAAAAISVPVETDGGSGTAGAHWDDTTFSQELMTGFLNSGSTNPLSRMTAASMLDLGYLSVNVDAAELYVRSGWNPAPTIGALGSSLDVAGSNLTLSVPSATDLNGIAALRFYRETSGLAGLQHTANRSANGTIVALDTLVGERTDGGLSTTFSTVGLAPGTYTFYARSFDTFGSVSSVVQTTVVIPEPVPVAPSTPDLVVGSDFGDSTSDDITNDNTPTFTGTAVAGSTVTLFADGVAVGTAVADGGGAFSVTASTVADGARSFTATATVGSATSAISGGISVTIDTVAPTVLSTAYDREVTQALTVTLDDALAGRLATSSFTLENLTTSTVVANTTIVVSAGSTVATLDRNDLLPNGNYRLTLPAANLTDVAGNPLAGSVVFDFRQLAGDADNSGTVDFQDLVVLAQNYNTTGRTFSGGNFDYSSDGLVDFADLVILAQNYNASLALVSAALSAPTATAGTKQSVASKRGGKAAAIVG